MSWLEITLLVLAGAGAAFLLWRLVVAARFYFKLRGERIITCPETEKPEAVKVADPELAGGGRLRAGLPARSRGRPGSLRGMEDRQHLVRRQEVRLLRQAVRGNPLARPSPGAARPRAPHRAVDPGGGGKTSRSFLDPLAGLLELPHHGILPPRAPRARHPAPPPLSVT